MISILIGINCLLVVLVCLLGFWCMALERGVMRTECKTQFIFLKAFKMTPEQIAELDQRIEQAMKAEQKAAFIPLSKGDSE